MIEERFEHDELHELEAEALRLVVGGSYRVRGSSGGFNSSGDPTEEGEY